MASSSDPNNRLVLSYLDVRRAVGLSGLFLPIFLGPVGLLFFGIEIQDNMSAYYHTPLRDVFVGTLCAMSVFLFCYRGYGWIENWTANLASAAALAVALFPMDYNSDPLRQSSFSGYIHSLAGGLLFSALAFYSLYHFPRKSPPGEDEELHQNARNIVYRTSGIVILLSMMVMGGYLFLLPETWKALANKCNLLFWMESVALWSFAAAWLAKGRTIVAEIAVEMLAYSTQILTKSAGKSILSDDSPRIL